MTCACKSSIGCCSLPFVAIFVSFLFWGVSTFPLTHFFACSLLVLVYIHILYRYNHRNGKWLNADNKVVENQHFVVLATKTIEKGEQIHISENMCRECGGRKHGYGTAGTILKPKKRQKISLSLSLVSNSLSHTWCCCLLLLLPLLLLLGG